MKRLLLLGFVLALALPGAQKEKKVGTPGEFDYYLVTLSWSPAFCASHGGGGGDPQCAPGRQFAFVLHGLWPQYNKARQGSMWPQFCSHDKGLNDPKTMLDVMPSEKLVEHEWTKHGTCSGLGADGYFSTARKAFQSIKVPAKFAGLQQTLNIPPGDVKQEFVAANSGLSPSAISIGCSSNFLSEVRVCVDKDLKPVPCIGQRDCKAQKVRMPPVR